MDSIYIKQ